MAVRERATIFKRVVLQHEALAKHDDRPPLWDVDSFSIRVKKNISSRSRDTVPLKANSLSFGGSQNTTIAWIAHSSIVRRWQGAQFCKSDRQHMFRFKLGVPPRTELSCHSLCASCAKAPRVHMKS